MTDGKKPELAALVTEQNQRLRHAASATITELSTALKDDLVNVILPEAVFKEYFLDFFMYPSKHIGSPLLSKWIELAGGPYNPVDIIDGLGNIILTAPSAMIRTQMNHTAMGGLDFTAIASTYLMKRKITDAQATNYLGTILSTIPGNARHNVSEHIMRWTAIFDRYREDKNDAATEGPKPITRSSKPSAGILDI